MDPHRVKQPYEAPSAEWLSLAVSDVITGSDNRLPWIPIE